MVQIESWITLKQFYVLKTHILSVKSRTCYKNESLLYNTDIVYHYSKKIVHKLIPAEQYHEIYPAKLELHLNLSPRLE